MPDFNAPNALPEFATAAQPAATPQAIVTMQLDADVLAWFQAQQAAGGIDWQQDMNGVHLYMETSQARELDAGAEHEIRADSPDFTPF
jgi:uncharacterized protein (DUF4415 family)